MGFRWTVCGGILERVMPHCLKGESVDLEVVSGLQDSSMVYMLEYLETAFADGEV